MDAIGKQWNAACGQKEAEHCWCGRVTEWVRVMSVCKILPSVPRVGPILWWTPSGCGGPAARAYASSLVDDVWGMS